MGDGLLKLPPRVGEREEKVHPIPVVMPMEPEVLNRILQAYAGERPGEFFFPNYQMSILVPAGNTVIFTYWMPSNFVCTRQTPWEIASDYYHPDLTLMLYVDEESVTPYPAALTKLTAFNFGEHYVKRRSVGMTITNNTARDATVTFFTFCSIMHVRIYNEWYRICTEGQIRCLNDFVVKRGGRSL